MKKETIELVKKMVEDGNLSQEIAEKYCPELKESEDERIRKELLNAFQEAEDSLYMVLTPQKRKSILAWIEEQGEHANFRNKIQVGDKVTRNEDGALVNLSQLNRVAKKGEQNLANSEKTCKDEQKPANKIEPKFKVGDWITDGEGYIWQVDEVKTENYILIDCKNIKFAEEITNIDSHFHLWTIQDAKDGDVLAYNDSRNNVWVCIFKEYTNERVYDYCTLDKESFWEHGNWNYLASFNYAPATIKQRDTLLKAMADAGYTFDFEKKELKKMEQNPTWSEEDETKIKSIIALLKSPALCTMDGNKGIIDESIKYLKSIKERVQTQNTWKPSDEQMEVLDMILTNESMDDNIARVLCELKEQLTNLTK